MRIGLCGAPGAGKTALAEGLAMTLGGTVVVDDYVSVAEERTKLKLGVWASYVGNLYVALTRFEFERSLDESGGHDHMVTCGTMIDTITYSSLAALAANHSGREERFRRINIMMQTLALLHVDLGHYDQYFYLPLLDPERDDPARALDTNILEALDTFHLPYVKLAGSTDSNLARALEVIYAHDKMVVEGTGELIECEHEWVDARNEVVKSGEMCVKCHVIRGGNDDG